MKLNLKNFLLDKPKQFLQKQVVEGEKKKLIKRLDDLQLKLNRGSDSQSIADSLVALLSGNVYGVVADLALDAAADALKLDELISSWKVEIRTWRL